jgi:hypothetical protein
MTSKNRENTSASRAYRDVADRTGWVPSFVSRALTSACDCVRRTRRNHVPIRLTITPVASESGSKVRVEVTNEGTRTINRPTIALHPAPPGIRAQHLLHVVRPTGEPVSMPMEHLRPGASTQIELPSPLQPGTVYTKVLGLAPDDDPQEAVYGLPIETLLAVEVRWCGGWRPWPRPIYRAVLVRGEWCNPVNARA